MKNRIVGYIIIGIAVLIGFIIYFFNRALKDIVNTSCTHGQTCPMWASISLQTNISLTILALIIAIGLYFIFFGKEKEIIIKPKGISHKKASKALPEDEKIVFEKIRESDGSIIQADLVKKTNFSKVKITRLLDKLEGKGLIERRRRGMTNIVILKH